MNIANNDLQNSLSQRDGRHRMIHKMQLRRQFSQMSPLPWRSHKYPWILEILWNGRNSQFLTGDWKTLQNALLYLLVAC